MELREPLILPEDFSTKFNLREFLKVKKKPIKRILSNIKCNFMVSKDNNLFSDGMNKAKIIWINF